MSISPQLVCITSVAGLLAGSSVVGFGMCCGPLFFGLAAVQAPPDEAFVPVVAVSVPALVVFDGVELVLSPLLPHPATASATTTARMGRTGRDMAAQDNQAPRDAVSPPGRVRPRAPGPRRLR